MDRAEMMESFGPLAATGTGIGDGKFEDGEYADIIGQPEKSRPLASATHSGAEGASIGRSLPVRDGSAGNLDHNHPFLVSNPTASLPFSGNAPG